MMVKSPKITRRMLRVLMVLVILFAPLGMAVIGSASANSTSIDLSSINDLLDQMGGMVPHLVNFITSLLPLIMYMIILGVIFMILKEVPEMMKNMLKF